MKICFTWIIALCRILVGGIVFKTGFDYRTGGGAFVYQGHDEGLTGFFVMALGLYFVFSGIYRGLFGHEPTDRF